MSVDIPNFNIPQGLKEQKLSPMDHLKLSAYLWAEDVLKDRLAGRSTPWPKPARVSTALIVACLAGGSVLAGGSHLISSPKAAELATKVEAMIQGRDESRSPAVIISPFPMAEIPQECRGFTTGRCEILRNPSIISSSENMQFLNEAGEDVVIRIHPDALQSMAANPTLNIRFNRGTLGIYVFVPYSLRIGEWKSEFLDLTSSVNMRLKGHPRFNNNSPVEYPFIRPISLMDNFAIAYEVNGLRDISREFSWQLTKDWWRQTQLGLNGYAPPMDYAVAEVLGQGPTISVIEMSGDFIKKVVAYTQSNRS